MQIDDVAVRFERLHQPIELGTPITRPIDHGPLSELLAAKR